VVQKRGIVYLSVTLTKILPSTDAGIWKATLQKDYVNSAVSESNERKNLRKGAATEKFPPTDRQNRP